MRVSKRKSKASAREQRLFFWHASRSASSKQLTLPRTVPLMTLAFRGALDRIHQNPAQAESAFQVGVDDLEAHLVDPGAAQQYLSAHVPYPERNIQVRFRAYAEIVFFCAHTAPQAHLPDRNARFSPGTADRCGQRLGQNDALVTPLTHPGAGRRGVQRRNAQFPLLQPTVRKNLA